MIEGAMILKITLWVVFAISALYACLKLALVTRPSRKKGWTKVRAYSLTMLLLYGAVFAGWIIVAAILYVT